MSFLERSVERSSLRAITHLVIYAVAFVILCQSSTRAEDGRFVEYGFSFQPPAGWQQDNTADADVRVQYAGPQREDKSQPRLNLTIQDYAINITDEQIEQLVREMLDQLKSLGMKDAQMADRRKITVSGYDALQMDLAYTQDNTPMRLRQVYIPVAEHKRTYLYTFVDAARYFDQSVAAAQNAINSFAPAGSSPARSDVKQDANDGAGMWTLLLVLLGLVALAIIVGAAYLLIRRRAVA
jgi:hypothetical protein